MDAKTARQLRLAYDGLIIVEGCSRFPTMDALAEHFQIAKSSVHKIVTGKTWKEVIPPKCVRQEKRGRRWVKQDGVNSSEQCKISPHEKSQIVHERITLGRSVNEILSEHKVSRGMIYEILKSWEAGEVMRGDRTVSDS